MIICLYKKRGAIKGATNGVSQASNSYVMDATRVFRVTYKAIWSDKPAINPLYILPQNKRTFQHQVAPGNFWYSYGKWPLIVDLTTYKLVDLSIVSCKCFLEGSPQLYSVYFHQHVFAKISVDGYPLVNVYKKLWFKFPCYSWENSLFRLGHVQ